MKKEKDEIWLFAVLLAVQRVIKKVTNFIDFPVMKKNGLSGAPKSSERDGNQQIAPDCAR